ncbi:IniB N-terminal domain-containing protein [Actinomycetospora atypica]|uniref:IniB N-terminal domain-containing protein n=1 Tax=Actinomycetospora atypica TaxID=1290095 RepID=A0ABV9YQW1_9PSEU
MTELADEPSSLLDWVTGLATDPALRARFADEPRSVLAEQGLADLTPADLRHALPLVSDSVAARLGADVDTAALATTAAQLAGEDPANALARQLGVVTESVLAAGAAAPPVHELDDDPEDPDDPVDLDDLDAPAGPAHDPDDLDGHLDPGGHHDLDDAPVGHPAGVDGPDPGLASVTVLPVGATDDVPVDVPDDLPDDDLLDGPPAEWAPAEWAPEPDPHDPSPPTDDPGPDDPGPDGADAAWFA